MNPENRKRVQEAVSEAGDYLRDKLPSLIDHPERNVYAHLWKSIKERFGRSYKDCDDAEVEQVLSHIAFKRAHPD